MRSIVAMGVGRRRRGRLITVVAALSLVAAACGSSSPSESSAPATGGTTPATEPASTGGETSAPATEPASTGGSTPATEPSGTTGTGGAVTMPDLSGQTINVDAVWSGDEQANFRNVLQKFEDETGAKVNYTSTGDDIAAVLGTAIEGGAPPDVAILPQPGLLKDFASKGQIKSVDDVVGDEVDANYAPVWRDLATVDGTLYGVWFKASNKSTVWYSVEALKNAGVEPPADWDSMVTDAQTILDSGLTPISVGGADGWTLTDWFENVYLRTAGPDMYDKLTNHEIPWTDDSVVTALNTLGDLIGQDDLVVGGLSGALQVDFPTSVTQVFGDDQKGAIVYEGDFVAGNITSDTNAKLGTDADFFPFPSVDGSDPAVVGGGDVAVMFTETDGAKALMQFLATPEAAEIWASAGGFTSPNNQVDSSVYPDDITRRSAEALVDAKTFRFDMSDQMPSAFGGTPGQGEWKALQDWLRDPSQTEAITQQLEKDAAAAF